MKQRMIHQGERVMFCVSSTQWSLFYQGVFRWTDLYHTVTVFSFWTNIEKPSLLPCPTCEKMHGVINLVKQAVDSKKNTGASLKLHSQCSPSLCDSKSMFLCSHGSLSHVLLSVTFPPCCLSKENLLSFFSPLLLSSVVSSANKQSSFCFLFTEALECPQSM